MMDDYTAYYFDGEPSTQDNRDYILNTYGGGGGGSHPPPLYATNDPSSNAQGEPPAQNSGDYFGDSRGGHSVMPRPLLPKTIGRNGNRKISPNYSVDHYQCTDWYVKKTDGTDDWHYAYTTCQYINTYYLPDGSGIVPGVSGPIIGTNSGDLNYNRADNKIFGCKAASTSSTDMQTAQDATANKAESRVIVSNPNYEYAGFVLSDGNGNFAFTNGQLLSLSDVVATLGAPSEHSFPPGWTPVGVYHSHPGTNPGNPDNTTGGVFSQDDENYANQYGLTMYVIDMWSTTDTGTQVDHQAYFRYKPNEAANTKNDISSTKC